MPEPVWPAFLTDVDLEFGIGDGLPSVARQLHRMPVAPALPEHRKFAFFMGSASDRYRRDVSSI